VTVTVRTLLDPKHQLQLAVLAGRAGLDRTILSDQVRKAGLAVTGFTKYLSPGWAQVLGNSEMSYLSTVSEEGRKAIFKKLCEADVACLILTRGLSAPLSLRELCDEHGVVLLGSPLITAEFMERINRSLQLLLAPTTGLHGVLVDVFGVGVLLLGHSGIGKSECALDLIFRGHRLVADDIVDLRRRGGLLIGSGYELIKHHMEIRGLGIINIKDLFGIASVRDSKRIDLCIELVDWDEDVEYERLGIDEQTISFLQVEVAHMVIPVRPGRNVAVIVETAARNQLLKAQGHHSAIAFQEQLMKRIAENSPERAPDEVE
jgi:HPr kinase/phosphorylase